MKLTIKIVLVVSLFSANLFAGDMGNGGFADGDMGNGGKTCTNNCIIVNPQTEDDTNTDEKDKSILTVVKDYLTELFG